MNCYDLVQFACQLALSGERLLESPTDFTRSGVEQYWSASKCRLDRWGRELKAAVGWAPSFLLEADSTPLRATMVEVLASEVLTRVWTDLCVQHDRARGASETEPIARSVLIAHLEARHRVLNLLVHRPGTIDPTAGDLNELRRQCERCTDLLLAYQQCDNQEGTGNSMSSVGWRQQLGLGGDCRSRARWRLIVELLPWGFDGQQLWHSANPDLNSAVVAGILSCFSPALFDGAGVAIGTKLAKLTAGEGPPRVTASKPAATNPVAPPVQASRFQR